MPPSKIRVAISGGGVAGAVVIHALLKSPQLDPHIFESAPAFKEAGIAFGVTRQAHAALEIISDSAVQALYRAGGVPMKGAHFYVGQGKYAGELVFEFPRKGVHDIGRVTTIVQRANFLAEFLRDIPPERMHVSKKLETIERQKDGSILIHFADGTTHECDILIGADGIRSTVRKIILGESDPAAHPRNTGSWAIFTMHPYERGRNSIGTGPINIEDAREFAWFGDGTMMLSNVFSNGSQVQFSIAGMDKEATGSDQWRRQFTAEELREMYIGKGWEPYMEKAVEDLLCDEPERKAIYLWEHPHTRTYVDGPVCILGDAAHATTPFQASGAGMSIEDAMIISTLLGMASSPAEAQTALRVYDEIRRPRTQAIVHSSWITGRMVMGVHEDTGVDPEKMRAALEHRWDFILQLNVEQHRQEAVRLMDAKLKVGQ